MRNLLTKSVLIVATVVSGLALAPATQPASGPTTAPAYPLTTCVVSGEPLGGEMGTPVILLHEGREVRLCCKSCVKTFKKDPEKYLKKLDEAAGATTQPAE